MITKTECLVLKFWLSKTTKRNYYGSSILAIENYENGTTMVFNFGYRKQNNNSHINSSLP